MRKMHEKVRGGERGLTFESRCVTSEVKPVLIQCVSSCQNTLAANGENYTTGSFIVRTLHLVVYNDLSLGHRD